MVFIVMSSKARDITSQSAQCSPVAALRLRGTEGVQFGELRGVILFSLHTSTTAVTFCKIYQATVVIISTIINTIIRLTNLKYN